MVVDLESTVVRQLIKTGLENGLSAMKTLSHIKYLITVRIYRSLLDFKYEKRGMWKNRLASYQERGRQTDRDRQTVRVGGEGEREREKERQ